MEWLHFYLSQFYLAFIFILHLQIPQLISFAKMFGCLFLAILSTSRLHNKYRSGFGRNCLKIFGSYEKSGVDPDCVMVER